MSITNIRKLIRICIKKRVRINIAESCTGGLICSKIIAEPNASKIFEQGLITYSNESKIKLLGVPSKVISRHGAVSEQTAYFMVKGLAKNKNTNFSIAITGIAGPSGATKDKPIGLVFLSFYNINRKISVEKKLFKGNRNQIREKSSNYAILKSLSLIQSCI